MVYPELQVRQAYVVDSTHPATKKETARGQVYFIYKDPSGDIITTDKIAKTNIRSISLSKPLGAQVKKWTIKLNPTMFDSKNKENTYGIIKNIGEDFILRIHFTDFLGVGPEHFYFQYGVVHTYTGMTTDKFYRTLEASLKSNFKRSAYKPFDFKIDEATITTSSPESSTLKNIAVSLTITEKEPTWEPGLINQNPVSCRIYADTVSELAPNGTKTGNSIVWGGKTEEEAAKLNYTKFIAGEFEPVKTSVGNIKSLSDLEWYSLKARADIYGMMGYPDINPSAQVLDKSTVNAFITKGTQDLYVIDIKYYFQDPGINIEKSERNLVFIGEKANLTPLLSTWTTAGKTISNSTIEETPYTVV